MRRFAACLLVIAMCLVPAEPVPAQFVVFDPANLAAKVTDYLERLYEITQRAVQISNELQMLEYWYYESLKLTDIPFQVEQLVFLEEMGNLLRAFDALEGQYQGLSYVLEQEYLGDEFDVTFPGWQAASELPRSIVTEGGDYSFETPLEYQRYRLSRQRQSVMQSLKAMGRHQESVYAAQEKVADLKIAAQGSEGAEQTRQVQLGLAALSAEQLIDLRELHLSTTWALEKTLARDLDAEMQGRAAEESSAIALGEALETSFGSTIPDLRNEVTAFPPPWMVE